MNVLEWGALVLPMSLVAFGWILGQIFPWERLRHPFRRHPGDGGIEYLIHDVDYGITQDRRKRTTVDLRGSIYSDVPYGGHVTISATTKSPSPVADEMHRIHKSGAMICTLKPATTRRNRKDQGSPQSPVAMFAEDD